MGANDFERYERQMLLEGFGEEGQKKLMSAKVLIIGAGGLGSPIALYLAGAGIGTIGIADADEVSISNLHRQIAHSSQNVGKNKAESAKESMQALNALVEVITYPYLITEENAEEIIGQYDFIIDAVDNFEGKFLISDTCVKIGKPFCHGGILAYKGQVMTYVPGKGPCYRCIFEEVPEEGSVATCRQVGVLGSIAGIIGSIQAAEAIKYFVGVGQLLTGKMYIVDGLTMETRIIKIPNESIDCPICKSRKEKMNLGVDFG